MGGDIIYSMRHTTVKHFENQDPQPACEPQRSDLWH